MVQGYKHYIDRDVAPLFAFGFGLSYTTFAYSDLSISSAGNLDVTLTLTLTNTGTRAGSEVVQVYVSYPILGIAQPEYQLRGFAKVKDVKAGETKTAEIKLDKYAVAYWDEREDAWVVALGKYGVHVGFSSGELLVQTEVEVKERLKWRGL